MPSNMKIIYQICRALAALILLQTLYFKFSGAPESVYIFTTVGAEPAGRIGSGVVELLAAVFLFVPRYNWLGAGLAAGVMLGAIGSHLTVLGIEVMGDGGLLFSLACIVFLCAMFILWVRKSELPVIGHMFDSRHA